MLRHQVLLQQQLTERQLEEVSGQLDTILAHTSPRSPWWRRWLSFMTGGNA
jgi:hypothetical protein